MFGRGSKRNLLPPYRTQQTSAQQKALPMGGSMQNVSPYGYRPPRRSSAVGIYNANGNGGSRHNNGSTPGGASNYRSHSVDGLLDTTDGLAPDDRIAEMAALVAAGSTALTNASSTSTLQPGNDYASSVGSLSELNEPEVVARREKTTNMPPNPQHRKSRSLDHFLDEKTLAVITMPQASPMEGTQSMQNLATPITPDLTRGTRTQTMLQRAGSVQRESSTSSAATTPERNVVRKHHQHHQQHSVPTLRRSPEGISSTEDEREDSQSVRSSSTSCGSMLRAQTRASAHTHRGNQNSGKNSTTSLGSSATGNTHNNSNNNANNKTILNRTIKKVRSLMKKP